MTKEDPKGVIERIHAFNWTAIFENMNDGPEDDFSEHMLFGLLHKTTEMVLLEDRDNTKRKSWCNWPTNTLLDFRPTYVDWIARVETTNTIEEYDSMLGFTDERWWTKVKNESDRQRWERLDLKVSMTVPSPADVRNYLQTERRAQKKTIRDNLEEKYGKDEMCACCYVLEKDAPRGKLFRCGWCRQVNYCSQDCQKAHWKKTHKKQCAGKKK
jgi:hypothetical protein